MGREMIKRVMAGLGYPEEQDTRQSAVWFSFLPEPSYDDDKLLNCSSFLLHKNGLPKVLLCLAESYEQYVDLAMDKSVFSQPPPYLIMYQGEQVCPRRLAGDRYASEQKVPIWDELDNTPSGCFSEERADGEVLAVQESFARWLRSPYSRKAVERLISIHTQRAAIVKELIQNACDSFATEIQFDLKDNILTFRHDGHPFMPTNVHAITALNFSCKPPGAIGYKGIGFKAVYQVCRRPQVSSGPFRFAFEPMEEYANAAPAKRLCPYLPVVDHNIPPAQAGWTEFHFPLEPNQLEGIAEALRKLESTLILFVAGSGLPLRRIHVPDRVIELTGDPTDTGGVVSIEENNAPRYWFYARHRFLVEQDRKPALDDFMSSTGREDLQAPHEEDIVVAVPLIPTEIGALSPNVEHRGRFHSFMPTLDEYPYPWDINGNLLLDEQRDHLRPPDEGSWNAALLQECGQALLRFLDEVRLAWERDPSFLVPAYYNVVPKWNEAVGTPQVGQNFGIMKLSFCQNFGEKPRVPVYGGDSFDFSGLDQTVWVERRFLPLFPANTWSRLVPAGNKLVSCDLDEGIWEPILCDTCGVPLFHGEALVQKLAEKDWPILLDVEVSSGELVPLIGRLCCYLGAQGIDSDDVEAAWLLLDSNRELYRPSDKPDGKAIYRILEDEFSGLPEYISKQMVVAHDGVLRFLQRDPSYFKGAFSQDLTDELREHGRKFWTSLAKPLNLATVISEWLNLTFAEERDNDSEVIERRLEWLGFLFQNRDRLQRKGLLGKLRIRLLARVGDREVWKRPEEVWLFGACPQGRDIETFIGDTPGVPLLSRKHAGVLAESSDVDEATLGAFLSRLRVQSSIESVSQIVGWFSPSSQGSKEQFCEALGIDLAQMPRGDINYSMRVTDYDFPLHIMCAFQNALGESANPRHRSDRLRAFVKLLEDAWPKGIKIRKEGTCHFLGAREHTIIEGALSTLATRLRESEWVPLMNDPRVLKRPRETCQLTEISLQLGDSATVSNYADLYFDKQDLATFLGFSDVPQGLTALDAIRGLAAHGWSAVKDPQAEFEKLYGQLAKELGSVTDLQTAQKAFHDEPLLFVPARSPDLRRAPEVLCGADSSFVGYLEDLADFYPAVLQELFQRLGVAGKVEEIHYLRYLVEYIWREQPPIDERRRSLILKCYRQLAKWATTVPDGQGIWASPEGKTFRDSLLFFGRCFDKLGWYSGHEKIIVFRDEPQIEELLAEGDEYVVESYLAQLRRTEEGLEPFLRMFDVSPASRLAVREVRPSAEVAVLPTSSNFRQNLFRLVDVLGPRLKQQLGEEFRDDAQSQTFFDKAMAMRGAAMVAELCGCEALEVVLKEVITNREKPVSCDASLDFGDGRARAYITGDTCSVVGTQLARELKGLLRTDTLPEPARVPVDRVIEDVAVWLDRSPDRFEERLQKILVRHLPSLATVTEIPSGRDVLSGTPGHGPFSPGKAGVGTAPDRPITGGETRPTVGGSDKPASQPPLMPHIDSQTVTVVARTSEEFLVLPKEAGPVRGDGKRPARPSKGLTEEQRREIGRRAELLVFRQEVDRLEKAGRPDLAENVVDRNEGGYDPYGPYDVDSFDQDEAGEWKPTMIEVKGHLDPDAYWFDMSEPELRMALVDSSTPYLVYLVLNLSQQDVRVETFDFRRLWHEERLHYQARNIRIELQRNKDGDTQ